jgi:hypothetical protein
MCDPTFRDMELSLIVKNNINKRFRPATLEGAAAGIR